MESAKQLNTRTVNKRLLELVLFSLVLVLAAYFRFVSLRVNPGWYSDEGSFIDFAAHLSQGQWEVFGTINAPLLVPQRPPLFLYVLTGAFKLFGADILTLRGLTAFYGVLTVGLVYLLGRRMFGGPLALLATFVMAVQPTIVAYNRIGFTYNQIMPLILLTIYSLWMYTRPEYCRGWALAACIFAALTFNTDFLGILAPILVALVFLVTDWRWLLSGCAIMAAVFLVLFLPFYLVSPQNFNLALYTIFSTRVAVEPLSQVINALLNYGELLRRESWIVLGMVGLFLLPDKRVRGLMIAVVGVGILLVVRTQSPVGRGLHYLMALFPLFAIGIAAFLYKAFPLVTGFLEEVFTRAGQGFTLLESRRSLKQAWKTVSKVVIGLVVFGLLASPLVWMVFADSAQSVSGAYFIFTGNDEMSLTPEQDANQVAVYLRQHTTGAEDMVLASPQIAWDVPGLGVDYWALAMYENKYSQFYIPSTIFSRQITLDQAAYAILDPLARDFAPRVLPGMDEVIQQIESWPLVFQAGEVEVYKNPGKK